MQKNHFSFSWLLAIVLLFSEMAKKNTPARRAYHARHRKLKRQKKGEANKVAALSRLALAQTPPALPALFQEQTLAQEAEPAPTPAPALAQEAEPPVLVQEPALAQEAEPAPTPAPALVQEAEPAPTPAPALSVRSRGCAEANLMRRETGIELGNLHV